MTRWLFAVLLVTATAHAAPADEADVEPIPGIDGFVVTGETTQVMARIDGSWFTTTEKLGPFDRPPTIRRGFDASVLVKKPAIALVVESYDGGSMMGTAIDELVILCASNEVLRVCGTMEIGRLEWMLDSEHRRKYRDGAHSLRKRPHIEVLLEPTLVAPGMLRLAVKRNSTLALPEGTWERETLARMDALRRSAGLYRVVDEKLVRVN
jgi:hypothetical protein